MISSEFMLIKTARKLTEVLKMETQAILDHDYTNLKDFVNQKVVLESRYTQCYEQCTNTDFIATLSTQGKRALKDLKEAVIENELALRAALAVSENFIQSLLQWLASLARPIKTYNSKGTYKQSAAGENVFHISVKLNQKL